MTFGCHVSRKRACLIGLGIGDAVGLARHSTGATSLAHLNALLAGPLAPPLHEQSKHSTSLRLDGACGPIQIGAWSHTTAQCLATAASLVDSKASDTRESMTRNMMMRLLQMWRTGRGACSPGHSSGIDEASIQALTIFERTGTKSNTSIHGCSTIAGGGSGALARVAAVVVFECQSATQAVAAAAENTRATHDVLAVSLVSHLCLTCVCLRSDLCVLMLYKTQYCSSSHSSSLVLSLPSRALSFAPF